MQAKISATLPLLQEKSDDPENARTTGALYGGRPGENRRRDLPGERREETVSQDPRPGKRL